MLYTTEKQFYRPAATATTTIQNQLENEERQLFSNITADKHTHTHRSKVVIRYGLYHFLDKYDGKKYYKEKNVK